MPGWAWAVLGFVGGLILTSLNTLLTTEILGWLELIPRGILRLAAGRLDSGQRGNVYKDEWVPELLFVLRGTESRPITRWVLGIKFALGLFVSSRHIAVYVTREPLIDKAAADADAELTRPRIPGPIQSSAGRLGVWLMAASILGLAAFLRFWHLTDWSARAFAATIGVATVAITLMLGRRLFGTGAGLVAALLLAVMPYDVVVSRQVLLDGAMTLCATAALYCIVRYVENGRSGWLFGAASMMGAAILSKETSVVLAGSLYVFFVLTPTVRIRARHLLPASLLMVAEVAVWPVMLRLGGHFHTGQSYLLRELFLRANHGTLFYFTVLPMWIGPVLLLAALAGLIWLRKEATWRERLLLSWIAVPVLFFTLWPVKGFQYLLPIAPPLAVLAGRTLTRPMPDWRVSIRLRRPTPFLRRMAMECVVAGTVLSLIVPTWSRIEPSASLSFPAGTGGLNGDRATGNWVLQHVPNGARLLATGPSAWPEGYLGNPSTFSTRVLNRPVRPGQDQRAVRGAGSAG